MSDYCTRLDVERRWGANNVNQWADIDCDNDSAKIQTQIQWATGQASDRIDADLAASGYRLPFDPIPAIVAQQASALAGMILYNSRAINISAEQISPLVRSAETFYQNWLAAVYSGVPIRTAARN